MNLRDFIVRQIEDRLALERKLELYCVAGPLPRPRIGRPPSGAETAAAAARAGDVAAERAFWEIALLLLDGSTAAGRELAPLESLDPPERL